jgi:glycosyltransferase involved in cell wall biosynthesis
MLSVIITCYNYSKYLVGCVESALRQTHRDIEVIIVNDGSTDDTDDVVRRFLFDPRIRYIKQNNAGQASAKNTGIRQATGELLAFLDADDLWESSKLEKQVPLFSDPAVGVVYSRARYIDEGGREAPFELSGKYLKPRSGHVTENLFMDNFVPFSSSVARRHCLEEFGGFDESLKMGIDWDLWLRLSTKYKFAYVDQPLLLYRLGHSGQMSRNAEERQRCSDRIMRNFLERFPGVIPPFLQREALAYTYCNRGYYFSGFDRSTSNRMYLMALRYKPFGVCAYRGLTVNLLRRLFPRLRRG